jgi:hypothetical protein
MERIAVARVASPGFRRVWWLALDYNAMKIQPFPIGSIFILKALELHESPAVELL